uniref:Arsenite methyltransferase n=1 Tax=Cyprinus carpio TaxID=7962 RepID=A0A8C2IL49_CYPCA
LTIVHSNKAVTSVYNDVKEYYGKTLKKTSDLKSNACVLSAKPVPEYMRKVIAEIHPDVVYGCGLVVPECLESCRVLDLGCGSGRDCYMLSQFLGEKGHVTGIDMTEELEELLGEMQWSGGNDYSYTTVTTYVPHVGFFNLLLVYFILFYFILFYFIYFLFFFVHSFILNCKICLGDYKFVSATYRLFKLPKGSESCQVIYNGEITGAEESFDFDGVYTDTDTDTEMEVDGDVGLNSSGSGRCWAKPKTVSVNPFELVQQLDSASVIPSTGGCCEDQESCCQ